MSEKKERLRKMEIQLIKANSTLKYNNLKMRELMEINNTTQALVRNLEESIRLERESPEPSIQREIITESPEY